MMDSDRRIPFKEKTASGAFLFSGSDLSAKTVWKETRDAIGAPFLKAAFPEKTLGAPFLEYALNCLKKVRKFGVLMIRPDPGTEDALKDGVDGDGRVKDLVDALKALCRDPGSGWGPYEPDILCGFFPDKTDQDCMEMGMAIQDRLQSEGAVTVSIGCARHPTIHFSKAQAFENARKAIDHAAFFGPGSRVVFDAVSLNISGDNRYQEGDIPGAVGEYRSALRLDPTDVNVLNSLGVCYAIQEDWARAVECFETALWLAPHEVMAVYNLALVDQARGAPDRALERYREVLDIQQDHFESLFQMGRLYLEKKEPGEAEACFQKAVSVRPGSGPAHRYLGECGMLLGKAQDAIRAFKRAVKINPNDAASLSALGSLFNEIGENPEVALAFCEQSVKIAPEEGLYRYRLGVLYHRHDRIPEAEKTLGEAQRLGYAAQPLIDEIRKGREGDFQ